MLNARSRGFTIIELMIAIAIIGLLLMIGLPNFTAWQQNLQVRNAAESILNGIQTAKTAAVQRNTKVQFLLGPGTWNASAGPTDWNVTQVDNPPAGETFIQQRFGQEGSKTATAVTVAPGGSTVVTFNGMGWVEPQNADLSSPFTSVLVASGSGVVDKTIRALRIEVKSGGTIRMCDPGVAGGNATDLPTGDPRAC